ncbi:MAG: hypothetical protein LBT08_05580 [Synergistaceae bacterium]|jgi:hypothetical protein|nr:hypothetical protein [Synergistaceae bacterium]
MKTPRQQGLFVVLIGVTALLLVVAQFMIQSLYRSASVELASAQGNVKSLRNMVSVRSGLMDRYKQFETTVGPITTTERTYPETPLEFYELLSMALKDNGVDHNNLTTSTGSAPGSVLQFQIAFTGPYYGLIKAIASIRAGRFITRISEFRISAQENGQVSGTMTVLSTARS